MTFAGFILYALVALVPVVFYRGVFEVFEFPKTELLATGALALFAAFLAGEVERARSGGCRAWILGIAPRVGRNVKRDPLGGSIALFLLSALLSTLVSLRRDASLFGAHESEAGLKTAFATAAVYFASRSLAADPRHLSRIASAAGIALAAALFYAALQLGGLDPFPWTRSATIGGVRRVPGTLGHANHLGGYIAMALPLLARLAADTRVRPARLSWIALALLSLPVLAATLSRGAWVACAAGLAVYGFLRWRASRPGRARGTARAGSRATRLSSRFVLPVLILAVAAFLIPLVTPLRPELSLRFRQMADVSAPSTQSRVHLWRAGIAMALDHPLFGVGPDGYLGAFPRYRAPDYWNIEWNGFSAKAHDELIQIAATQGFLGLLAALLVVLFAARAILDVSRHPNPVFRDGAAAAGGALAAFAVQGLVGFTVASTGVLAAAVAGWAAGAREDAAAREAALRPRRGAIGIAAGVAALVWAVFVLLPWLAEATAAPALRAPIASPERAAGLRRAAALAPWDARYATELGRSLLTRAFTGADPSRRARDLADARAAFERAARMAPADGELHALLARTLAAQFAAERGALPAARVHEGFSRAIALEPRNANVLELAAQGYLEMGLTSDARDVAFRCARLFPDYALPMADLGVAALLEGRARAAADTLTLALRRNWHGEEAAAMAAKSNYVAALREMRLGEVLSKEKR